MVRVTDTLCLFPQGEFMAVRLVPKDAPDKGVPLTEITNHRSQAQGPAHVTGLNGLYEKFRQARTQQMVVLFALAVLCTVVASILLPYKSTVVSAIALLILLVACVAIGKMCALATDRLKDGNGNVVNIRSGVISMPDGKCLVATHDDSYGE